MIHKKFQCMSIHNKVAAVYMGVSFAVSMVFAVVFSAYNPADAVIMALGGLSFILSLRWLFRSHEIFAKTAAILTSYLLTLIQMTLFFPKVTQFHLFYIALLVVMFTLFEFQHTSSRLLIIGTAFIFLTTSITVTVVPYMPLNTLPMAHKMILFEGAAYVAIYIGLTVILYYFSTEMHQIRTKLTTLATLDPLTGLSNRRVLLERGNSLAHHSVSMGDCFSLLMVDIDDFKQINDAYGHMGGDQVLIQLANLFHQHLRPTDLATRYGGEEFALLLPGADEIHATCIANRLCQIVAQTPFSLQDQSTLSVTISIGVSTFIAPITDFDTLMSHADLALYRAKSAGKNQFQTLVSKVS